MDINQAKKIIKRFEDFRERVEFLKEDLDNLSQEYFLNSQGYKFHYAVDFSEIFAFLYPYVETVIEREEDFIRNQLSLALLFYGLFGRLVYLPSYQVELSDHIRAIKGNLIDFKHDRKFIRDFEESLFEDKIYEERIKKIIDNYKRNKVISDKKDILTLINFAREKYLDICVLFTTTAVSGFKKLRNLLNRKILQPMDYYFDKEVKIEEEEIVRIISPWLTQLNKKRPGRIYANYIDALAVGHLKKLNEAMIPNKEIVLFVTRSSILRNLIDESEIIDQLKKVGLKSLVRRVDYFLTSAMNRRKGLLLLSSIKTSKILVDSFKEIEERIEKLSKKMSFFTEREKRVSLDTTDLQLCSYALGLINQINEKCDSYDNLRFALRSERYLYVILEDIDTIARKRLSIQTDIASRIISIFIKDDQISKILEIESESIMEELKSLVLTIHRFVSINEVRKKLIELYADYLRPVLIMKQSFWVKAYEIHVENEEIDAIKTNLFNPDVKDKDIFPKETLIKLIGLSKKKETSPELNLIFGLFNAIERKWNKALLFLNEGIKKSADIGLNPKEFYYLKTLIFKHKDPPNIKAAINTCNAAIKWDVANDPRFLKELGYLIWRATKILKEDDFKNLPEDEYSIHRAIFYTEQALKNVIETNISLKQQILNNLVWFYLETKKKDNFYKAKKYMDELLRISEGKIEDWLPQFFDTYATFLILEAKYLNKDLNKALINAVAFFRKSLSGKKDLKQYEKKAIKNKIDKLSKKKKEQILEEELLFDL